MYSESNRAVAEAIAETDVQDKIVAARAAVHDATTELHRLERVARIQQRTSGSRGGVFYHLEELAGDAVCVRPVAHDEGRRMAKTYRHVRTGLFHVELRGPLIATYEVAPHPNAEQGLTSQEAADAAISWVTRGERPPVAPAVAAS